MFNIKTKKGSVLAYSLIIMFMLLSIALIMSKTSTISLQNSITTTKSVQAIQIAESGSQLAKSKIISLRSTATNTINDLKDPTLPGANCDNSGKITGASIAGGTYDVAFYKSSDTLITDCNTGLSDVKKIQVQGTKGDVTRAVEVSIAVPPVFTNCGDSIADKYYNRNKLIYGTITVGTQRKCWLDRNLGVKKDPRDYRDLKDSDGYGWYYQWGRDTDGHQEPSSTTTTTMSAVSNPGHDQFIIPKKFPNSSSATAADGSRWYYPNWVYSLSNISDLWLHASSGNNPCPTGFRVPTGTEFNQLGNDDINRTLKFTYAGFRDYATGTIWGQDTTRLYWKNEEDPNVPCSGSYRCTAYTFGDTGNYFKAAGLPVRCIQD